MARRVLRMLLGFCLLFFNYGAENESHAELQRAKLVPVSRTGPGAMHQDEVRAELFLQYPYTYLLSTTDLAGPSSGSGIRIIIKNNK